MPRQHKYAFAALSALMIGACSTHPIQEDVTRVSTLDIVQKLRCEARNGLLQSDLSAAEMAATEIGYDFTLDITEFNKATGGLLEFTDTFTDGSLVLNLKGGADKSRQNERFFRRIERFQDLMDDAKLRSGEGPCSAAHDPNLVYPIEGSIGADEVVRTYASLTRVGNRFVAKDGIIFSDELTFTTDLSLGINPTLKINAVAGQMKLTNATFDGSVQRKDVHKVTIAISAAPAAKAGEKTILSIPPGAPALPRTESGVASELNRLRYRNDDRRAFEALRFRD